MPNRRSKCERCAQAAGAHSMDRRDGGATELTSAKFSDSELTSASSFDSQSLPDQSRKVNFEKYFLVEVPHLGQLLAL
eukprot:gene1706-biopygen11067